MAKINIPNITSVNTIVDAVNQRFDLVEAEFEKVLYRQNPGTEPNEMDNDLDMNNRHILNLPSPATPTSPVRLQDLQAATVGGGDHGLLIGLTDDDHPQYLNESRGDVRYYQQTEVDTLLGDQATYIDAADAALQSQIDFLTLTKSDVGHIHDDRYYTEPEMDVFLANKSDIGHTHPEYVTGLNLTAILSNYSLVGHTHVGSDLTGFVEGRFVVGDASGGLVSNSAIFWDNSFGILEIGEGNIVNFTGSYNEFTNPVIMDSGLTTTDLTVTGTSDFTRTEDLNRVLDVSGAQLFTRPNVSSANLPRLFKKLNEYDYGISTQATFKFGGFGSSVGNGATLTSPSTDAPLPYFTSRFNARVNPAGVYSISGVNESVDGSVIIQFNSTHWASAIASNDFDLVLFAYGMNDAATAAFNSGQTLPGFRSELITAIETVRAYGADIVVMTTPHFHTARAISGSEFSMPPAVPQVWPTAEAAPVADADLYPPVADSVITADILGLGSNISVCARHLRINEMMREVCATYGVPLIDVERYWFQALYEYAEDDLFDSGQYNHPNDLGHQVSYQAAIDDFCRSLAESASYSTQEDLVLSGVTDNFLTVSQGTWSPVLSDGTNNASMTVAFASYTRIGDEVTVRTELVNIDTTGMTGTNFLLLQGLPFTANGSYPGMALFAGNSAAPSAIRTTASDTYALFPTIMSAGAVPSFMTVNAITSGSGNIQINLTYRAV